MLTGLLTKLVHLSQQSHLLNTRLVPDNNDIGYGIIEDSAGREVFFHYEVVESRRGFDDLRLGQRLEYTLENAPYLRAASVRLAAAQPADVLGPAV
ncbi:MAG: cold shock domain-containing protein [Pirellulaceae bacterium]|nr:cold shock domain-containing protein [Pirellulaceae bacterium]